MKRLFTSAGLRGFERIQKFTVDSEGWSVDNGMLTPTLKVRRRQVEERFKALVDEMYARLDRARTDRS